MNNSLRQSWDKMASCPTIRMNDSCLQCGAEMIARLWFMAKDGRDISHSPNLSSIMRRSDATVVRISSFKSQFKRGQK
jgi:hypothetical protein